MKAATDNDNWREKYFDNLARLEKEQQQFRAFEVTLKRLAGRLCTAALGQSPKLDEQLKKLQSAIRRDASAEDLEKFTPALSEAIQTLDHAASSAPAAVAVNASSPPSSPSAVSGSLIAASSPTTPPAQVQIHHELRPILTAIASELRRDEFFASKLDALDSQLEDLNGERLQDVLSTLADLVSQRISRIERAKQEVEVLLTHMVGKLDEIGRFVAEQNRSQTQSQASSETLNIQLAGEMRAMGESVEAANDLTQIRVQVRSRLDTIDRHLQEFREREAALAREMQSRSEQMRSRITELESEASRLQNQLKDEQRLSNIDALTGVPNRLAYEKRVDDEMKRWQRFKQPTCLAVWDVDRFKAINDTYGHRAGDRVLTTLAKHLSSRVRTTDFLARYGGEEFVMLLPGTTLTDAMRLIDELRELVGKIGFHFRGTPVSVTISVGVTAFVPDDSAGAAFDRADKALYRAKESGRNRCVSG
ncbi:MAG TPA: diguanylate cyclase [Steroidobacteraceae bacterium]|nr:diguanylate cyclase [Steroidobacteraceae bacterium]